MHFKLSLKTFILNIKGENKCVVFCKRLQTKKSIDNL